MRTLLLIFLCSKLFSQQTKLDTVYCDCEKAREVVLTGSKIISKTIAPSGPGDKNEISSKKGKDRIVFEKEHNTAWYKLKIETKGKLVFDIIPTKASDDYDYSLENQDIKNILKAASNLRFGAEFRIKNLYLRGGYSRYGKVFASGELNKDLAYNGISGGVGFRQQKFYFDLAYSALFSKNNYIMYYDPGYLKPASISNNKTAITATIGFKF